MRSRTALPLWLVIVGGMFAPQPLLAQDSAPVLRRSEVTASTGWIGAEYGLSEYDQWHASLFGGLSVGHYGTDHLKTEVEAGWLSKATARDYEEIQIGADRVYAASDYTFKDFRLSLSQSVQFGRNAWVHPFLGVGVDLDVLRSHEIRPAQQGFVLTSGSQRVAIPAMEESETTVRGVPFFKGGFKMYVSERAFVLQEFKFGVADGLNHVLWKTGLGIDF
jgi:hypothetical protein